MRIQPLEVDKTVALPDLSAIFCRATLEDIHLITHKVQICASIQNSIKTFYGGPFRVSLRGGGHDCCLRLW